MSLTRHGLRRAGFGGLTALVCASTALIVSGAPANAAFASTGGTIALVDTNTTAPGTQGATSVTPGGTAQALGDVQVTIPNTFDVGDQIRLALFDRSAAATAGETNSDAAHKLVFSGTPSATVTPGTAPATTVAPTITATTDHSPRATGTDEVVLTVGNKSTGTNAAATWTVTVSGLKVDVGTDTAPGEIRIVPFAKDLTLPAGTYSDSPVFGVASADTATPVFTQYTVPGYVLPASFNVASPAGIVADGSTQTVGDVTVAELSNRGLVAGDYTVTVSGATVKNDTTANKVTATLVNPATGESLQSVATTTAAQSITADVTTSTVKFHLNVGNQALSNASKVSVVLHGLQLASTTNSTISYSLTGGSVSDYLSTAGTSPAIGGGTGILADSAFGGGAAVNQNNIDAPALTGTGTALTPGKRIGGSNRYATAAQVALQNKTAVGAFTGQTVVLASGEAYPDALSSGFLSQRIGSALSAGSGHGVSVLLTRANTLPTATMSALSQLGTTKVYIVGGDAAVSPTVQAAVQSAINANVAAPGTGSIVRLAGHNRYDTNEAVNNAAANIGTTPIGKTTIKFGDAKKTTALLATGEDYADALSFGPATRGAAGDNAIPLILTRSGALSPQASDELNTLGIKQVVIGGGTGAVATGVETELGTMGIAVKRLAGANRYDTATMVADFETASATPKSTVDGGLGFDPDPSTGDNQAAALATGLDYADALAGGPLAANGGSPILLTTSAALQPLTQAWLVAHKATYSAVVAYGLQAAVSDAALAAASAAVL